MSCDTDERPSKLRKLNSHGEEGKQLANNSHTSAATDASVKRDELVHNESRETSLNHEPEPTRSESIVNKDPASDPVRVPLLETAGLSKSQQKKLRKKAEWEAKRPAWKEKQKEKRIAKRERKRTEKEQLKAAGVKIAPPPWLKAVQLPVTILYDCDFESYMNEKEIASLANQIVRAYSDRRKSRVRSHLMLCSFSGKLKQGFESLRSHYHNWRGVEFLDCDFVEASSKAKEFMYSDDAGHMAGMFSKYMELDDAAQQKLRGEGEVVYLTSEADEDLTELKPYSTYIIGGLVDKNREKGLCYKRATSRGIRTARLPIGMFMDMTSRKVLATNHVNEIMLKWLECGDWALAFSQAIPKRKGGKVKGTAAKEPIDGAAKAQTGLIMSKLDPDQDSSDDELESDEDAVNQHDNGDESEDEVTIVTEQQGKQNVASIDQ